MKILIIVSFFIVLPSVFVCGQDNITEVEITEQADIAKIILTEQGLLKVNIPAGNMSIIISRGVAHYEDFGAKGDGQSDDLKAIVATHAFANEHNLPVKCNEGAEYYIGGSDLTALIQTNVDFGNAAFVIDDRNVIDRTRNIFVVASRSAEVIVEGIASLKRGQRKIDVDLPGSHIVMVTNDLVRRYIRFGPNQNRGSAQTDIFRVEGDGNVDPSTPIIWDFDQITEMTALPIDSETVYISGGKFTTIANQDESKYNYYRRGFSIKRSNVVIDGLQHYITGEGESGAPYGGFLYISDCSYVTVRNTLLTGHKTYRTIGSAGVPVSMGSYDISVRRALDVSFVNCRQTNDINDRTYWGIMGSNYSKNLLYDSCTFSRFDAHMGVTNATIRNSTMGHMGVNAIGNGTLLIENSTLNGRTLVNLRRDYGSTWQGEFIIRDCTYIPAGGLNTSASLIGGQYSGMHDFGYTCYMPYRITFENLKIQDSNHPEDYSGPAIFADFNPEMRDSSYVEEFPYVPTKEVILKNVVTSSGRPLQVSDNPHMFRDVKIITQ